MSSFEIDSAAIELPPIGTSDGELLEWMGTDAMRWARAFSRVIETIPAHTDADHFGALLIGWFANAIEAGRSAGRSA